MRVVNTLLIMYYCVSMYLLNKTLLLSLFLSLSLASCFSPSKPTIHFASKNSIAIKYHAYDMLPTVTAEAIDMAVEHCKKHGKGMKLFHNT